MLYRPIILIRITYYNNNNSYSDNNNSNKNNNTKNGNNNNKKNNNNNSNNNSNDVIMKLIKKAKSKYFLFPGLSRKRMGLHKRKNKVFSIS